MTLFDSLVHETASKYMRVAEKFPQISDGLKIPIRLGFAKGFSDVLHCASSSCVFRLGWTSGSCVLDLYEVWIEAVE